MANYMKIKNYDVANGTGLSVTIFFSGCDAEPKCPFCFNSEAWDFNAGQPFTEDTIEEIITLLSSPQISNLAILGGEPLAEVNARAVSKLIARVRFELPDKKIWLWSHRTWNQLVDIQRVPYKEYCEETGDMEAPWSNHIWYIIRNIDVLVDGRFVQEKKDLTLKFRGSSNQRVIDCKKSLEQGEIVLYLD